MELEIVYFDGCPNWRTALERLREALSVIDRPDVEVRLRQVTTIEDAGAAEFTGSPTVLVDGIDPFAEPGAGIGLSCRVFRTPAGAEGSPAVAQLVEALRESGYSIPHE